MTLVCIRRVHIYENHHSYLCVCEIASVFAYNSIAETWKLHLIMGKSKIIIPVVK